MAKIFIDTTPLKRYPEFRRMWISQGISTIGSQLAVVGLAVQIFTITHSTIDVGLISLVQLFPALFGALIGGSIADAMGRRKLLIITGLSATVAASLLALNSLRHHPIIWLIYVLAALSAVIQSVDSPARTSVLMSIVDRDLLMSATALRSMLGQFSQIIGPTIGGVLLAVVHVDVIYWINAGSFLVVVVTVLTISAHVPKGGATRFGLRSIVEGFQFLKGRQAVQGCFIADLNATILGMPTSIFPAIAISQFHGGSSTTGLLYAAPGIGSAIGSSFSGWTMSIRRPGYAVCVCIAIWGVALTAFGFSTSLALAVVMLSIAGFADQISAIFRATIIQYEAPDRLRGRLSSIQQAVVQSGPRLGNTEAGIVAGYSTPQISIVSGGLGCVLGIAIVSLFMPKFVHYELGKKERVNELSTEPL